jgi:hypothetical protein
VYVKCVFGKCMNTACYTLLMDQKLAFECELSSKMTLPVTCDKHIFKNLL